MILIHNYNFSSQWRRDAAADIIDKPQYQKNWVHLQVSTSGSEEAGLHSFNEKIKVLGIYVDRKYFFNLWSKKHIFIPR